MKTLTHLIFTLLFCFGNNAFAEICWDETFGGTDEDRGNSVAVCSDGGYIITGFTESYGAGLYDVWLIKTDAVGNMQWNKTFGGSGWNRGFSVAVCGDDGYIITGMTDPFEYGICDVWLIKTDELGNMQWDKTFGGINHDAGYYVAICSDNGYVITGCTWSYGAGDSDVWLIKTDGLGNIQWNETFGGIYQDEGHSVAQCSDGGYIITGWTEPYGTSGSYDLWLIKTNASGNKVWDKIYGGEDDDFGYSVAQCRDSGYIITGSSRSYNNNEDIGLIKTDALGNKIWDKNFGGTDQDIGYSVAVCSDDGYIITGRTESYGAGWCDAWLIKTDSFGNKVWDKTFGGSHSDHCYSVAQCNDDGYIIVGDTNSFGAGNSDVWLIYYKPEYEASISDLNLLLIFLIILTLSSILLSYKTIRKTNYLPRKKSFHKQLNNNPI